MGFILALSIILNLALIYACRNMYNKNIAYEDIIIEIDAKIRDAIENMRHLDVIGAFEAEDEVGYTFQRLLDIVNQLEGVIDVGEEQKEKET